MDEPIEIHQLTPADLSRLRELNALFAEAFEDPDSYAGAPANDAYLTRLLAKDHFMALTAACSGGVIGGLTAYQLEKCEQERSEIYIYDLAVAEAWRRKGVATRLIAALQKTAASRGAWVIYVQADYVDPPAIALYEKLGVREEVLHFDIPVAQ